MRGAFILLLLVGLGCCCSIFPLTSGCWKLPVSIISTAFNSTIPLVQKTAKADLCAVENVLKSTSFSELTSKLIKTSQDTIKNIISTVSQLIRNGYHDDLLNTVLNALEPLVSQSKDEARATLRELITVVSKVSKDVEENCYDGLNPAAFHIESAWNVIEEFLKTVKSQMNM
ncbi:hypothetical protein CRE_03124 [Caenorhabditis remanei]|uniref:Uncharacterized protein n=1 Tax=Caenorhabditis remanei TaxID=31234 RepID=E3LWN7_CAERE|nr:hypothetical protein CRE_03124 [Caenorhabditis remanei]